MTPFPHPTNKTIVKSSRIVTLPHWQGYKIGMKMSDTICGFKKYENKCIHATTTLPIRQNYLHKSDKWLLKSQGGRMKKMEGSISSYNRTGIYIETYKFINNMVTKDDIKPMYRELNSFGVERKTNDSKVEIVLDVIKNKKVFDDVKSVPSLDFLLS